MAQRPQRDVVGGPGSDARDRQQRDGVRRRGRRRGRGATSPSASARHSATSARPRARGIGSDSGSSSASRAARREEMGQPVDRARRAARRTRAVSRAAAVRAAATVTCWPSTARTASSSPSTCPGTRRPGVAADQRAEHRVAGERVADRDRVAVGVEEAAYALDGGREVAQVVEPERRRHERRRARPRAGRRARARPCRCRAAVGACARTSCPVAASTPGHGPGREEAEQRATGERRPDGEPQLEHATGGAAAATAAQLGRRRGVDLADRVVELAHAAEPGREGDVGVRRARWSRAAPARSGRAWPGPARAGRRRAPG